MVQERTETNQAPRALVVDDDADAAAAVQIMLTAIGFAVEVASSAQEAIALLPGRVLDLAVLDLMMEETDSGVQVARALRRTPGNQQTPILLLTAAAEKTGFRVPVDTPEEREWLGVDAWLDKPVTFQALQAAIERPRHG